jgi:hypothetical protein
MEFFNNHRVFISDKSFKQNKIIKKELRSYVKEHIIYTHLVNLVSIGGESYLFGLTSNNIINITNYTNSESIYNDANLNNKIYRKKLNNNLVSSYNIISDIISGELLIINLAKLNINLLNIINRRLYKKIIIINCHHTEFWKRITLLDNYKLITRKQFVSELYFVTVNILEYKYEFPTFISLGTTCAVAYQLNKLGLRYESYPFDWTKTDLKKINNVLENNFELFNNVNVQKFSFNHQYADTIDSNKEIGSYILKNDYNISFAHEVLENTKLSNNIESFKNKLEHRINKFKSHKNDYIIFTIINMYKLKQNELTRLNNNLKQYFNNFKILYISDEDPNNEDLIQNVIWINVNVQYIDWKYTNFNWSTEIYTHITNI